MRHGPDRSRPTDVTGLAPSMSTSDGFRVAASTAAADLI